MKMKKYKTGIFALLVLVAGASQAAADPFDLTEYAFNVDGSTTYMAGPVGLNSGAFDFSTGLGTLTWKTSAAGAHSFIAYFDHELDQNANTFFNEVGTANGTPVSGQSWEIDEPGLGGILGDIYVNVGAGSLDNMVGTANPEDVSMAMGWGFNLASGWEATITLTLADALPATFTPGFYLQQNDPDSGSNVYYWGTLAMRDTGSGGNPVPEPATMLLMGTGLAGLVGARRKKKSL